MSQLQLRLDTATAASAAAKADPANEAKASVAVSLWSQLQLDVAGACLDEAKADPTNETKMRAAMLLSPYSFMFLRPKWFENPGQLELEALEDEEQEAAIAVEDAKRRLSITARRHSTVAATLAEGHRRMKNKRERERYARQQALRRKFAEEHAAEMQTTASNLQCQNTAHDMLT
jgi:hypothetical protein